MPVKPSWQKLETYLVIALSSAMIWLLHFILVNVNSLGIPGPYATILATALGICSTAIVGYFTKLRHDAYAGAGLPDPDSVSVPGAGLPGVLAQAQQILKK